MKQLDKKLFDKLTEDRKESATMLEKTSMRGLKTSVVEKYSDQAHFIYELIQNADDVGASEARFELYKDKLVFVHNGKRFFSVTDLDTEEEDTKTGALGDLNAITSIANSNKTAASIGKFGVGFKAVFQYTTTPFIYDPQVAFKIERFIVPIIIEDDCNYRKKNETAFVFPFDHPDRKADEAYEDILHKLQNLVFPTLFLNNLKKISFSCGGVSGDYVKRVKEKRSFGKTTAEKLEFVNGKKGQKDRMWLFSRETAEGYKYSCGFFIDEKGKLIITDYYAFCFFPTKKDTNLSFIINAPFLLTDSREGIKATDKHNIRMIELLADLSADSFVYLRDIGEEEGIQIIDDDILSFIPINEELYLPKNPRDDISLFPFYDRIRKIFTTEQLLPSFTNYVVSENAYMAYWSIISDLFSNEQLAFLVENEDAEWVLPSKGWETIYRARDGKADYLGQIIENPVIQDMKIIEMLTPEFISNQSNEWLFKLYEFILETDRRVEKCKTAPIFLDSNHKPAAAYDDDGIAILFLDDEDSKGYKTVSEDILSNEFARKLIDRIGIKNPELKDKIFNKILSKDNLNPKSDFRAFLDYYIELVETDEDTYQFLEQLEDKRFILATSEDGTEKGAYASDDLYFPTEDIKYYFEGSGEILFVCMDEYYAYLKKREVKYLDDFLEALGVSRFVRVYQHEYEKDYVFAEFGTEWEDSTRYRHWYDYRIDEDERVIDRIIENEDKALSELLWKQLVNLFETVRASWSRPVLGGVYEYFFRTDYRTKYEGIGARLLRNKPWIVDRTGKFRAANEISLQEIGHGYDTVSSGAKNLLSFLEIQDNHPEYEDLDDSLRQKLEAYDSFASIGLFDLSHEQIKQLMQLVENKKGLTGDIDNNGGNGNEEREKTQTATEKVIEEIKERVKNRENSELTETSKGNSTESEIDSDESTKAPVDYSKKIEQAKQKCEDEISRLAQIEEAQNKANESPKYSYAWFTSLLQLEAMANGDDNSQSREVSICFAAVEREPGTSRTLILKHPDKNIPQVMEELVDIPLDLTFGDGQSKRLIIEVANVKSYTLRVKVKPDDFLNVADFTFVSEAKIVAQNPTFLTRELQKEFAQFAEEPYGFDDLYNLQENLCENIRFIFGPPGTGKTTYLAKEVLIPLIKKGKKVRVLVLTPTNKAADVLASRIIECMGDDNSYDDWLIRYGVTGDEKIEKSNVFRGKELEIDDYNECVVITTMARLPYDYFIDSTGHFNYLRGINWDYMVVDEASMIPLVQMVYMLYKKTPKQFIVAGDPFQIEPTTTVSDWKSENIYKMVKLEEFSEDADTVPHKYKIDLLTKQYRSIESIGEVFSQLTYGGVLKHARSNEDAKPLNIERFLDYENMNIIRFPVSQYESIYRAKRLKLSSYQVYSALFTYEFATYLAKALARSNSEDDFFSIGIIAPYGAQAGLIDKLIASADIPENINLSSGTVHGYQGDECDIVIALFNPPPHISTNKDMFLNKQNIINVAISRARDYLFVLMPDEETENVQNLFLINKLRRLIEKDFHSECNTKELEELLFDNCDYLEENAFSTGHQLVNVYGLPEKRYEIRSEENALDVQVHGSVYYAPFAVADEEDRPLTIDELTELVECEGVYHRTYGNGIVSECDGRYIEVDFSGTIHKFPFPKCFDGSLVADDTEIQQKLSFYNANN